MLLLPKDNQLSQYPLLNANQEVTQPQKAMAVQIENNLTPPDDNNLYGQALLRERGILNSAIQADWTCSKDGFTYPIHNFDGICVAERFKNYDSHAPKYKYYWIGKDNSRKKPDGADYYFVGDIRQAVKEADGLLYIANGEPSVLAHHSAGINNVLSWFGESSIPKTLIKDFNHLGVTSVIYAPDNDQKGRESATKLRDMLYNTDIQLTVLDISAHVDHKGDTNDLLIHAQFNSDCFIDTLNTCPPLVLPAYDPPQPKQKQDYDHTSDDFQSLVENVAKALGIWGQSQNNKGWTKKNFSSPFRDDNKPSAGFNFNSGTLNDFGGQSYNVFQLADYLNIEYRKTSPTIPQADNLNAIPDNLNCDDTSRHCLTCGQALEDRHHATKYCNKKCKKTYKARQKASNHSIVIDDNLLPVNLAKATHSVNLEYISNLDPQWLLDNRQVGVLSPTASGKTILIKRYYDCLNQQIIHRPAKVLVITHRKGLSRNIANKLGFTCYLDNTRYKDCDTLVICLNSLHKLLIDGQLPFFDALIIDEPQHLLNHAQSATFKDNEAINAYQILRHYLCQTPYLLTLDAHLSQIVVDIIGKIRPAQMTVIENTYRKKRGTVKLYLDEGKALDNAIVNAGNTHKLVVACETVKQSQATYEHLCDQYEPVNVLLINRHTSSNPNVVAFLDDPDNGLERYRAIVHTSTIDSGVSFDNTPAIVCGLFNGDVPHVASDINQMIARVRNPVAIHLYVANKERKAQSTSPLEIYNSYERKAMRNNALITLSNGKSSITTEHQQLLYMQSKLQADRNKQANHLLSYVVAYLKYDGFNVQLAYGKNKTINQMLTDKRDDHAEYMKQLRLDPDTTPLSSDEYDDLREDGDYTLTDSDHSGYTKGQVLNAVGELDYTEQLDADLNHPRNRQRLYALTDVYSNPKYLNQCDIDDEDLLHKQKHRTLNQHIHKRAIRALFGVDDLQQAVDSVLSASELDNRINQFVDDNRDDLKLIGLDPDNYKTGSRLAKALLARIAVKLESKRISSGKRGENKRERFYQIDAECLYRWSRYKESRQRMIAERQAKKFGMTV